jgi:hypothetical protein
VDIVDLVDHSHINSLAHLISHDIADDIFCSFVDRLLVAALQKCHGTLIAVLPHDARALPEALQDSVVFETPIDLHQRLRLHLDEGKTLPSVDRLQAAAELVTGFVRCDGITVFNQHGKVVGYRAFIKGGGEVTGQSGGARTRAFESLRQLVQRGELIGAFFRSQDGRMDSCIWSEAQ